MGGEDRGAAMAASVVRAARFLRVPADGIRHLSRAHALAMEPRAAALSSDRHPLFLHPGRTVLILLRDVGCTDAAILSASALLESEDLHLRVPDDRVRDLLPNRVAALIAAVPMPGAQSLSYDLVTADEDVRLLALAERLDHLRHAHLRDTDASWRAAVHAQARAVYLPVAQRTHARLAQRYEHWCRTFARRVERDRA
jgi:(p)ppGpp synthase/HD superfamily hydrolase